MSNAREDYHLNMNVNEFEVTVCLLSLHKVTLFTLLSHTVLHYLATVCPATMNQGHKGLQY